MATTTNFGWETPDDTDLVKDGALAMRTLGNSIDSSFVDLKGGTTGQILSKASNTDLDYAWITNDVGDITAVTAGTGISGGGTSGAVTITNTVATTFDAAGDVLVGTGADAWKRLAIGTAGQVLKVNSGATDLEWGASGSTFVGCSLSNSANFSINNSAKTTLTYNGELYDTDGFHSTSSNTSRITIPSGKAGKYLISLLAMFDANATGTRLIYIMKNGTDINYVQSDITLRGVSNQVFAMSLVADLAVNDYIESAVFQNSGGLLGVIATNLHFSATYLGA